MQKEGRIALMVQVCAGRTFPASAITFSFQYRRLAFDVKMFFFAGGDAYFLRFFGWRLVGRVSPYSSSVAICFVCLELTWFIFFANKTSYRTFFLIKKNREKNFQRNYFKNNLSEFRYHYVIPNTVKRKPFISNEKICKTKKT